MGERKRNAKRGEPPIPLEPIDLLVGLAPGVELQADDLPPDLALRADGEAAPAITNVAEAGKLLRTDDDTVRRLIRSPAIEPSARRPRRRDRARAGVVPRSRTRPGE